MWEDIGCSTVGTVLASAAALRSATEASEHGVIAFHITNRYLELKPVVGDLASDAGLVCYAEDDSNITQDQRKSGKAASKWVIMARREADMGGLPRDRRWQEVSGRPGVRVWTDDFSNILGALRR